MNPYAIYRIFEQARHGLRECGSVQAPNSWAAIQASRHLTQYPITVADVLDYGRMGVPRAEQPR